MPQRQIRIALAALLLLTTLTPRAGAWSASGHHIIALIAFDLLDEGDQQKLLDILTEHPRYAEDFTPSPKVANATRWRVGTAGYWPDIARKTKYDRPTWHYQLASTLTIGDESKLEVPDDPGPLPDNATLKTQKLHIAQAIELCRKVLGSKHSSGGDRALALCWLGHLVGDSHQPCHAGSLYAAGIFPKGDRGANSIPTKQSRNMHALWDGLLGDRYDEAPVRRRYVDIVQDKRLQRFANKAMGKEDALNPLVWLEESRNASKQFVYTNEVLTPIRPAAAGELVTMPQLYLTDLYLENAGNVARIRAIQAGHRLAAIWREGLTADGDFRQAVDQSRSNPEGLTHWLNTRTGSRHNSTCKNYENTSRGRFCGLDEGRACGLCGG
ncbi:MAG: S1/P1 nuclease [Lacipirellulaceae bacterium]